MVSRKLLIRVVSRHFGSEEGAFTGRARRDSLQRARPSRGLIARSLLEVALVAHGEGAMSRNLAGLLIGALL